MSYRADKQVITAHKDGRADGRTDTQTDAGNDNTRRPKLASGKNAKPQFVVVFAGSQPSNCHGLSIIT